MAYYQSNILTKDAEMSNSTSTEFTLYVNNLPGELNENGFLQIFNHYGEVIGHFYRPNATWGYITYGKRRDAQNAIKDLHDVPPLRLKVSFTKERRSNEIQFTNISTSDNEKSENYNYPREDNYMKRPHQTLGRGKPMDIFKRVEPNMGIPKYSSDNELLYAYPTDPYTYNPYENAEPYASSNMLWTRGQLTISQDGKRHVSLGRGHTMYEIPDPNPEVQTQITNVYEKRTTGLYEYGNDMLRDGVGRCEKCSKITKFTCERCHSFFCSKNCQVAAWPQHKIECQAIPDLVLAKSVMNGSQFHSNTREQSFSRNMSFIQKPLRRPKDKSLTNMVLPNTNGSDEIAKDQNPIKVPADSYNGDTKDNQSNIVESTDQYHTSQQNNTNKNISISVHDRMDMLNTLKTNEKHNVQTSKAKEHNAFSFKQLKDSLSSSDKVTDNKESEHSENNVKKRENFKDVTKIEEEIAFSKYTFLPPSKFVDVKIIVGEGREYWVQKVEDQDSIKQLMNNLENEVQNVKNVQPIVGKIYAVKYRGVWGRALVKSLNPVTVHYVDFGNDEVVNTDDFHEIYKFRNIPAYCATIRLSEKAYKKHNNLKYKDIITVKCISVDNSKVINVEVQGEHDESTAQSEVNDISIPKDRTTEPEVQILMPKARSSTTEVSTSIPKGLKPANNPISLKISTNSKTQTTFTKPNTVVNTVSQGETGILEIHAELRNNVYGITLLPNNATLDFEKLLNELPPICERKAENFNHRPQIGDIICGRRLDGDWLRGYLLSLDTPLKMAIIEEARMMEITKTVPCPEDFVNICAFGVTCEIINTTYKFRANEHYEFKVLVHKQQNEIEIEISTSEEKVKAIVKPWTPEPEQKALLYAKLRNKSEVRLTAYQNHISMYARSLDVEEVEYYNNVMQTVAKCAQTAPSLNEPPVVGQMVMSRYIDDNYYRAIVTKVEDSKIRISYIDFGNTEVTNIKNLKILDDQLKQLRSCTSKIVLKDVLQDTPMTKEICDYLSDLVGREVPLICTFDGVPSKDGVYLKLHNGECVNKTINEMLVPTWNKISAEEDTTCYMINDLSTADIGEVGDVVEAVVLHCIEDGSTYSICPLDYHLMTHVFDIMPKMMTEYCEKSKYYIPREKELCLALFDNGWYRAVCLRRTETPTASDIFFVDFGNIEVVAHTDIRLMPKDFLTPNALASICKIVNIVPNNKETQYSAEIEKRIAELIVVHKCIKIKIIECSDGIYNVEVPLIRDELIKDGLISP
ncbi:vreteno isoform X2 [Nomia melanderi]|uniref:vreteno isoform X2 n=1 Tax=Nomia melanderi TaxID=2448451 RepID=UPI00130421CA|nr:uncharacterized protein LOC116433501 isoform X2 [Nomia melanderi]